MTSGIGRLVLGAVVAGTLAAASPASARQVPADTIRPRPPIPDSLVGRILPDTMLPPALRGGLAEAPGSGAGEGADEEVRRLPDGPHPLPGGPARGVWEWDRDGLRGTRALTLAQLLDEVPGITLLRGGDHGQPAGVTAFGLDPGRIRVFRDGLELPPLDGGVVDLSRVAIAALEQVRVERRPGELRVELRTLRLTDPRPYTVLEVGTGDLNTNVFRGTFGHPSVAGGHVLVALDRVDTQGPFRRERGASFGALLSYTLFTGDRGGIAVDFRRMTSSRPAEIWSPDELTRTEWAMRGTFRLRESLVLRGSWQSSALGVGDDLEPEDPGWQDVSRGARRQFGLDLELARDAWWARAGVRRHRGGGWPRSVVSAEAGGHIGGLGGVSLTAEREGWRGEGRPAALHARAWTGAVAGISLFAEADRGSRGVRRFVPPQVEPPDPDEGAPEPPSLPPPSFTERSGMRLGAELRVGGLHLVGAALRIEADTVHPQGLPLDRGGASIPGGIRSGFEVMGTVPLSFLLRGLAIEGSVQFWEAGDAWSYLPENTHHARVRFHDVFLESRNLEVRADVGVRGRDAMTVFTGDPDGAGGLATVPSYQSWFARVQVRVATARVFVDWENFTLREGNRDFPDRILPGSRTLFGVRWTMWN